MPDFYLVFVYVDKNKNMTFVSHKECQGLLRAAEPYFKLDNIEWENVSGHIISIISEIAKQPLAEDTKSDVMKQICGNKGFRHFSKKHICIAVEYIISEKEYEISNWQRLRDGSYGSDKGTLSEKYSIKYSSPGDAVLIQENFLKAYADALEYLKETGEEL